MFHCNEQYYTYLKAKYFHDDDVSKKSLMTEDPYELIKLQKKIKNFDRNTWLPEAEHILYLANMAKYSQNSTARTAHLNTRNDVLGEASYSKIWGIGSSLYDPHSMNMNWSGRNVMGKILMEIRDSLRERQSFDENNTQVSSKPSPEEYSHYSNRSCWFCGEMNHISKNCRHGQAIQCNSCFSLGHKAKFCSYS